MNASQSSETASATAAAPASVGNVAVGFDLLGHALQGPEDHVRVSRHDGPLTIAGVSGIVEDLPRDVEKNTATRAVAALCRATGTSPNLCLEIEKGIPLAAGLGGSAASAVAAVVAANRVLGLDLSMEDLYPYALAGEEAASGAPHGDNVGCQLLGGLVLALPDALVPIPVPRGLVCAAVHPAMRVHTREARAALGEPFALDVVVAQGARLAGMLAACHSGDLDLLRRSLEDVLVEPRRAGLIPGFDAVKRAALESGALGASISGAGPTVFGWFSDGGAARRGAQAMCDAFAGAGLEAEIHLSPVGAPGARLIEDA
ncbi:MAG: homoserine kinase [Wenzhouxiangellaceae bacterium]|nr:homoserine kinase [Wenzhouxiangellaceae bacterium]